MKFTLMSKEAESPLAWTNKHKARTVLDYSFYFNPQYLLKFDRWCDVFYFRCDAGNISCASKNPFSCIWQTLEHESIGMAKYTRLKDDTRSKGFWKNL